MKELHLALASCLLASFGCLSQMARADSTAPPHEIDPAAPLNLRAGPIQVKFQDGQLRYLRVGDREIVRRIYFAVRDGTWATIPPKYTHATIRRASDGFEIALAAECRRGPVDFSWTGTIVGDNDGKIIFHAEGLPGADFQSNRIGLCVLYGSSLAGQSFETLAGPNASGEPTRAEFPHLVSPELVAKKFQLLRYTSPDGCAVSCSSEGATFDMEDQRNWGDSSYKAYAPLPYAYPSVKQGQKLEQTITLTVGGVSGLQTDHSAGPVHFRIGDVIKGAKLPKIIEKDKSLARVPAFVDINRNRGKYAGAKIITWPYTSATHLPDDDTLMENPPALADQAATIRSFAPDAVLHVEPITVPASSAAFSAAWAAQVLKHLAEAGVDEACFDPKTAGAGVVLADVSKFQDKPVLAIAPVPEPGSIKDAWAVQALAVKDGQATIIWLINRTPEKAQAVIEGLEPSAKITNLGASNIPSESKAIDAAGGRTAPIDLDPYGVYRVETTK